MHQMVRAPNYSARSNLFVNDDMHAPEPEQSEHQTVHLGARTYTFLFWRFHNVYSCAISKLD
jgi:hypothetical protein